MTRIVAIVALGALAMLPSVVGAAALDGSVPMLCALTSVVECSPHGECERTTHDGSQVPPFVKVNVPQRMLSSVDGARTSPIVTVQRNNGHLMLQGVQNVRAWGVAIDEQTGRLSAAIAEAEGAIVITGACTVP